MGDVLVIHWPHILLPLIPWHFFPAQKPKQIGKISNHNHSSVGAETGVVPRASPDNWTYHAPQPLGALSRGRTIKWLSGTEQVCSPQVQIILLNNRKPTTRETYLQKWKCFQTWCSHRSIPSLVLSDTRSLVPAEFKNHRLIAELC